MDDDREITIWIHRKKIVRKGKRIDGFSANCDPLSLAGCTAPERETVVAHMVDVLKQYHPTVRFVIKDAP